MLKRQQVAVLLLMAATGGALPAALAQDSGKVFKLDAETNQYNDSSSASYGYPAPKMMPVAPKQAPVPPPKHHPLQASAQQTQLQQQVVRQAPPPQQRPPMQAQIQQQAPPPGVLPGQFMGRWMVMGTRQGIKARPEYQNGIGNIFTQNNSQTWNFNGQPGSYSMSSDTGLQAVQVGNCTASTAFIRYQHQIGNTMAREAIVMQLSPDGRTFQGMERISIVKPGEAGGPRAEVTYNLIGQRQ